MNGIEWNEMIIKGMEWNRMEWNGFSREMNRMEWNEFSRERNRMEWNLKILFECYKIKE